MSQIDSKNDSILEVFHFSKVYAVFSNFLTNCVDWNNEKSQQERSVLSCRLFEEFIPVFVAKMDQIGTENDKESKIFYILKILYKFVEVSTDFVDWKVLKAQQGKNWLSSSLS